MRIVVGHANPDFDAYAATVAATKLFDDVHGVFLGSQNANVRAFHNLHEEFLDFVDIKDIDPTAVEMVIMVDTRDPSRVAEIGEIVTRPGVEVIIYDHHPPQEGDLQGADDRSRQVGATTSILVHELRERGVELAALEASVMLLGIHEDTGSLTYPNATAYDADAAAWLMAQGADMEVVNQFLARTLDPAQRDLLEQLQGSLQMWDVNGQQIAVGTATASDYVDSAGVLTHYVVEDMGFRVAVAVVQMPERLQVVARSRLAEVDVGAVLARLGGGGHAQAASAGFRDLDVDGALRLVREALEAEVRAPLRAADVMSAPVRSVEPDTSMAEAGELMARWGHGGVPVVDDGTLVGVVTRKDVDKALRHRLDHAPVKGFVGKGAVTVSPDTDLSELERLLASRGVGRLPVMVGTEMVGIVTRKDVLRAEHGDAYLDRGGADMHPQAKAAFLHGVETLVPAHVAESLRQVGEVGDEVGLTLHVVGGFVRDMVLGRPNLDVDIVVEGDGVAFAERAAQRLGARVKVHRRFGTAVLVLPNRFHIDIASSRTEYYTKPGALPTVERSSLRQDLFRRDFTINAMSACLDPECFGTIADPFGGLKDLDAGIVRIMHALSFIDDPTRVLRAARFEVRYGFTMDAHTQDLARRAVDLGVMTEVSGARIREELYDIFDEPAPVEVLTRLERLGALGELAPEGATASSLVAATVAAEAGLREFAPRLEQRVSTRAVLVAALATAGHTAAVERWIRHFRVGKETAAPALSLADHSAVSAMKSLQSKRGMKDSRLYRVLAPFSIEAIVLMWARGDALVRERIERYSFELATTVPSVSGRDLIALGYTPSPQFATILARTLDDVLDGRALSREAQAAALRRHAAHALGAPDAQQRTHSRE